MNLLRRSAIVYLLFITAGFTITLITSCKRSLWCESTCGCDSKGNPIQYDAHKCGVLHSVELIAAYEQQQTDELHEVAEYELIRFGDLSLATVLNTTLTDCARNSDNSTWDFSFVNTAYACTPPIQNLDFQGAVKEVQIFADRDYDADHPAGSNIIDVFEKRDSNLNTAAPSNYKKYQWLHYYDLVKIPAKRDTFQFTIRYVMNDSRVLQSNTKRIIVAN